ncbi:hypothetical protein ASPSYDRAFT_150949 [Aspergillus sydowii CBS 593.65]|uniref:RING-type domain-containing protein n=1 Tax=Aspergillus sydowii CBS 593.65 TaxID=1036612 RepID=A0A1L9TH18_9EURO|nr:uncharacterized protein ASPSYDRAFT_150949 [Aspergillus sydowii CBS 593.65]OJJ58593.1 hypothetical protein ASPSYDRAFT_150949 [Aspergillus sydowii CBS 593.65]
MEEDASPHSPPHGDSATARPDSRCTTLSLSGSSASPEPQTAPSRTVNGPDFPPHAIVRLIQCSRCSLPFRTPLRLPCGDTLCRECLPPIRPRTGVSYPANEERKQGFRCYWGRGICGADHCLGDCGADVLLTTLVGVFDEVLGRGSSPERTASESTNGGQTLLWKGTRSDKSELDVNSAEIGSEPLSSAFDLVRKGRLGYDASEIRYEPFVSSCYERYTHSLDKLRAAVRNELDCHVCYSLILDPLTTPCGHTFCGSCVAMALSHSNLCPICRRKLNMSSSVRSERINKRLSNIIQTLLPDEVASRRADFPSDMDVSGEDTIPLAVVSLAFPTMPIGLHIFEPRYRLMIQRIMENRSRKFGMVMPNRRGRLQPGLGRAPFMQYGTLLTINRHELLPDGRSLLIATGTSRFKVVSWELVDGYHIGKIQRVDDVSVSEEEAQESRETTAAIETADRNVDGSIDSMSTQQLFQLALDFVLRERRQGAPWLHPRVLLAYGALPTDPALFPWWFATILPNWDEEKYTLLATTAVRQRLKITARWVKRLESRNCHPSLQTISGPGGVVTSFTTFPMSVSISFGPGGTISHFGDPGLVTTNGTESYISQTLVLGLFLAIFVTQMAANVVQVVRARRQTRLDGNAPAQPRPEPAGVPTEMQGEAEGRARGPNPTRDTNSDLNPG